ncbi:Gfo/Idh/MocA family oxidoreductase [Thalassospira xianhensis]|uniref:Gfo/Idh/MocA-like oxidoreductase N-terminal domain-containing protein n=1 Tax=Thalassospira xianhensis MCCC 1A02616 TaxID=1177929 RepID=A0A367UGE1_9PROT|nr:Gfo/Idh/MocA family oxidoreductase [Thalassospira xianhensis]RCK07375.1 hypothetical protein TH5_03015 [Thalassospira xianhensis MCCC 1A02616]
MINSTLKRVLLIGCGNIGMRHLQAVTSLDKPLDIMVIEPDDDNRAKAEASVEKLSSHVNLRFFADWRNVPKQADLAIVATPAQPRRKVLEVLLTHTAPKWLFLEKVVFVTRRDFDEMIGVFADRDIRTVINCSRRGWPSYDALREKLKGKANLSLKVIGSNWNLASNSIHFIDLAVHLFGGLPFSLNADALIPEDSKHRGCVEFTGSLIGACAGGGNLTITNLKEPGVPLTVEVGNADERWIVEEGNHRLTHFRGNKAIASEEFYTPFVSQMGYLYQEMLYDNVSRMTPFNLSAQEHRPFIDALRNRLGQSLEEDAPCPIT